MGTAYLFPLNIHNKGLSRQQIFTQRLGQVYWATSIDHQMKVSQMNKIAGFVVLTIVTGFASVFAEDYLANFEGFARKYHPKSGPNIEGTFSFSRFRYFAAASVTPCLLNIQCI